MVCDPPYGVRAGGRKSHPGGRKGEVKEVPEALKETVNKRVCAGICWWAEHNKPLVSCVQTRRPDIPLSNVRLHGLILFKSSNHSWHPSLLFPSQHIASTAAFPLPECLRDLLAMASKLLTVGGEILRANRLYISISGVRPEYPFNPRASPPSSPVLPPHTCLRSPKGRLVYFLPCVPDTYHPSMVPSHPALALRFNLEQVHRRECSIISRFPSIVSELPSS